MTISVTPQCFTWQMEATSTSTLLDENLTFEFKRKNSFTLSKSWMKTEQFLFTVKSSVYSQLNWRTWPQSKGKTPCSFDAAFLYQLFFEWLRNCVQETIELWPKYRETKLKSTKKRNFLALKDIFLTSPGCCLTLASSLDVLQVRFASWSVYIKEAFRYF